MLNNNEIWKQCTHIHEVSNTGKIRNIYSKEELKLQFSTTGYYYFTVRNFENKARKHLRVHVMVAKAFIPNLEGKPHVNHIDGNKLNNTVSNLEWCTHTENMLHAKNSGLLSKKPRTTGQKLGKTSKYHNVSWSEQRQRWCAGVTVNKKRVMSKRFKTEEEAALHVNYIIDTLQLNIPKNIIV
jgi:HNH endonuclease family protein